MKILRNYQIDALRYCRQSGGSIALFIEMGLGKTLIAYRFTKCLNKILIITPYSAFNGWQAEIQGDIGLLTGIRKNRLKTLLNGIYQYYMINREGFIVTPEIKDIHWDAIILDESTCIKNPGTQISKFFCKHFKNIPIKIILTGTPAPEGLLDYFQQLKFLNIMKEKNYYDFRAKYFLQDNHRYTMKFQDRQRFMRFLSEKCFYLTRQQAGLLDKKIYQRRIIAMSTAQRKVYNRLCQDFILGDARTKWIPVKFQWLRQLCSGYIDNKLFYQNKIDELLYLLNTELRNRKVVIWCQYINEMKELALRLPAVLINGETPIDERDSIVKSFNEDTQYLIAHPNCFKFGSDLSIADTCIYFSSPLGLESRLQSEARLTRGKARTVFILDLLVENSLEIDIADGLRDKKSMTEITNKIIKRIKNDVPVR